MRITPFAPVLALVFAFTLSSSRLTAAAGADWATYLGDKEASHYRVNKLFSVSDSPAETIIDIAATFGVDTVVLGGSKRARLVNLLKGNVISRVASSLPETMRLIVVG